MARWRSSLAALLTAPLLAALLTACGGGGHDVASGADTPPASPTTPLTPDVPGMPDVPVLTGNTATDGYNWFNYRRAQLGLRTLTRNTQLDTAAQGHSAYQRLNNTITHNQTVGQPGFTGATLSDRLRAAGYAFNAAGEVISATTNGSGAYQAEQLVTAIYHRFVIFEPTFRELGTGAATVSGGYTYFTADFGVSGAFSGLGLGKLVSYPVDQQSGVPTNFFSDTESPDPVPNQNEVGYPISVHADSYGGSAGAIVVQSFSVAPRGGSALSTRLLGAATDGSTRASGAAIVPLAPLRAATTYDVSFSGTVGGMAVTRNWSFTTN